MASSATTDRAKDSWQPVLRRAGAVLEGDRVTRFDRPASRRSSVRMTPLLDRAWLALRGSDAAGFLHDQLTTGVADLDGSSMRLAAYCNAQGRVLALLRTTRARDGDGDGLLVELPGALVEPTARRLAMFVLRADVRIEQRADMTALGIWGRQAPGLLDEHTLPVPREPFDQAIRHGVAVTRLPGPEPRFQLTGEVDTVTSRWEQWRDVAAPAPTADWRALDILAGLPDIGPQTTDRFLPQSLGLETWNALSFRKGCYPGQEVIARLHYRGRLKRHLYRAAIDGDPPEPGTAVQDANDGDLGIIVSSAPVAEGNGAIVLAVLHERGAGDCHLAGEPKLALTGAERLAGTGAA